MINEKMMLVLWLMCVMYAGGVRSAGGGGGGRYTFYREMYGGGGGGGGGSRRVFGGESAAEGAWPAAGVLLDRYWAARCSGSVLAERWLLTAAHCVTSHLAYVNYNTNRPNLLDGGALAAGNIATVHYLYRHPEYKVVQEELGRGPDVTLLHHDVGLVRTTDTMRLRLAPQLPALRSITAYTMKDINGEVVQIFGFGRTEKLGQGEELVSARLRVVSCERSTWVACACGVSGGEGAEGAPAGVCSGDSGGPVVYRGSQVGVVSMGPVECAAAAPGGARGPRAEDAPTSVFTAIYEYAPLINATILDTEDALRMMRVPLDSSAAPPPSPLLTSPLLLVLILILAALTSRCY